MDARIVLFISLGCVVFTTLGQTTDPDGQRCTNSEECPDRMCCVHNPLNKPEPMKRFIFNQYAQHDHGYCRRERQFNESCWPLGHDAANPALYDYFCPCTSGYECRGLIVHESEHQITHRYPVCQTPESDLINSGPTASGPHCIKDADCGTGKCCVIHPLSLKRHATHGYCRDLRAFNETCDLIDIGTNDFQCPCVSGLECRGLVVHHFGGQTVHENTVCQTPKP